jgi:hypothetical protein
MPTAKLPTVKMSTSTVGINRWHLYISIALLPYGFFGSATTCASPPARASIFSDYSFCVTTTLLAGMTGISLHMQWPLTSRSHGNLMGYLHNPTFLVKIVSRDKVRRVVRHVGLCK